MKPERSDLLSPERAVEINRAAGVDYFNKLLEIYYSVCGDRIRCYERYRLEYGPGYRGPYEC